jgi:hypothetical protein
MDLDGGSAPLGGGMTAETATLAVVFSSRKKRMTGRALLRAGCPRGRGGVEVDGTILVTGPTLLRRRLRVAIRPNVVAGLALDPAVRFEVLSMPRAVRRAADAPAAEAGGTTEEDGLRPGP